MSKTLKQLKDAVRAADIESVKQLLQEGVDPNQIEGFQKTSPLSLACVRGQPDIVKLLLEKLESAPEELQQKIYQFSLREVASSKIQERVEVVKVLLCLPESDSSGEEGASKKELAFLNQSWSDPSYASSVVCSAVKNNNTEVVKLLLLRFKVSHVITSLLFDACSQNNPILVAVLLEKYPGCADSQFDASGRSLLMVASAQGYNKVVEVLLENGANIDFQDEEEWNTALMAAVRERKVETVKLLLEKGASVDITNEEGKTALLMQKCASNNIIEIIRALLAKNADINKQDDKGRTALINAVESKSVEAVKLLLDNGAKTNLGTDTFCRPPLNSAVVGARGHYTLNNEIPRLLLQYNAPVNLQDEKLKESPLIISCMTVNKEMCELLLDKGANVTLLDKNETCALLHAVRWIYPTQGSNVPDYLHNSSVRENNFEIIEMLLKSNKDTLYLYNSNGERAVDALHKIPTLAPDIISSEKFPELKKVVISLTSKEADVTSSDETAAEQTLSSLPSPAHNQHPITSSHPSTSAVSSEQPAANISSSLPPAELTQASQDPNKLLSKQDDFDLTENKISVEALLDNEAKTTGSANTSTSHTPVPVWQRKFDVVLYGVTESKGTSNYERVTDDLKSAHSILHKISNAISDDSIRDCTRMGKYSPSKTRPLLVKLVRERDARLILHSVKPENNDGVAVKRHMSPTEKQAESILLKKRWELAQSGLDKERLKIRGNKLFQDSFPIGEVVGGVYKPISN